MHAIFCTAREQKAGKRVEWDGLAESPRYKFRNESLIEWLEITPEEERQQKTITSGDERRRRDHERDEKRSREAFLPLFTGVTLLSSSGAAPGGDVGLVHRHCGRGTGTVSGQHAVDLPGYVALEQRMISRLLLPSCVRLATYSCVRGSRRIRARQTM
jgi:hypothetical protein